METTIEKTDVAFIGQLDVFCNKVPNYQNTLGLSPVKITNLTASRDLVLFVFNQNNDAQQYNLSYTAYKNLLRYGMDSQVLGPLPPPPVYPATVPALVPANVQAQFADMIQDCVRSSSFTENIGHDLGIIKPKTAFDPGVGSPNLSGKTANGGHPVLHAKIGKYEAFEIWKDSADGQGYKLYGTALHPDFVDNSPLPAHGASASWKYKAIYMYQGQHAGTWSNEVVVMVYGLV